jgi:hypothetical protein
MLQVAFVNTDQKPLRERVEGYRIRDVGGVPRVLVLEGIVEKTFPHPEAPQSAGIQVLVIEEIARASESRDSMLWAKLYLALQTQRMLVEEAKEHAHLARRLEHELSS